LTQRASTYKEKGITSRIRNANQQQEPILQVVSHFQQQEATDEQEQAGQKKEIDSKTRGNQVSG
jgi:hypothetical protein